MTGSEQVANVYATVLTAARQRRTVYYSDIAPAAELNMGLSQHRKEMGALLELICVAEVNQGRPMLFCLVIRKGEKSPGTGFHPLGVKLNRTKPGESEADFLAREQQATFDAWGDGEGR